MKKKIRVLFIIPLMALWIQGSAQDWREMIQDPEADFGETKAAFYAEFGQEEGARGSGYKQFKRWEWFMEPRISERGQLPNGRVIYEEVKRAQLQKEYRGESGNWQLMGPIEEPQGANGYSIGRLSAMAFHPTDTNIMWAGAPSGGMWKSVDNGISWQPLTDHLPNIGVAEIVVNPNDPDTLYLCSGDGSVSDTYSYGVMMSTDGGENWDTTGLSFGVNQSLNIRRLLIDSTNTNVLIAATTGGIYRTDDAGVTWGMVKSGNFCDLEFKPYAHDTVYASTNSGSSPFYISVNNGQTWTASTNGLNSSGMQRVKISVSKADPEVIYALASASNNGFHGIYRSNDAGANWTLMSDSPNLLGWDVYGTDEGGQGWYSMELAASPLDANEIKVGGINIWKSNNGGTTFFMEAHWTGENGTQIHADQHRLEYHPTTNQFYVGCDGGFYRRSHYYDGFESISTGMSITQFYRMAGSYSNPDMVMAGAQDNGTMLIRDGLWLVANGGDGMEAMIHPSNTLIMYSTTQNGNLYKSTNGGTSFGPNIAPATGSWVTPFMMDPGEPEALYAASGTKVYRSDDAGGSWWEFSPNITTVNSGWLTMLDVAKSNIDHVVAGSRRTIYLTTDIGGEWTSILPGLPGQSMTFVKFDPLDENTIWVTFSGYSDGQKIYRSTNSGQTWENMSMNLPNLPANCIEIERSSKGGVYVGTDVGVYYWDRTLTEWEPFMTGLPNVIVSEMEIHEPTHKIRAATFGRGVWESDTRNHINVGVQEHPENARIAANIWPNPASDFIDIELNSDYSFKNLEIIDAYGRLLLDGLNPNDRKKFRIDIQSLTNGMYYVRNQENKLIGRFIVNKI